MRVVVIRHHDVDTAGFIADAFEARGAELTVHLFPTTARCPRSDGVDHVVVLGAVSSVNDEARPRSGSPRNWPGCARADAAGVPVLGICFGAQALCAALGGRVEAMDAQGDRLVHGRIGRRGRGPGRSLAGVPRRPLPAARRRHGAGSQRGGRAGLPDRPAPGRPVPPRGRRAAAQALAGLAGRARGRRAAAPTPTSSWPTPSARSRPRGPGRTGWSPPRWPSGTASALAIPGMTDQQRYPVTGSALLASDQLPADPDGRPARPTRCPGRWGASLDNPRQPTTATQRPFRWVDVPLVML